MAWAGFAILGWFGRDGLVWAGLGWLGWLPGVQWAGVAVWLELSLAAFGWFGLALAGFGWFPIVLAWFGQLPGVPWAAFPVFCHVLGGRGRGGRGRKREKMEEMSLNGFQ